MFMGNPHAPSTEWLEAVAGPGGYKEAEPGDTGTQTFERDGATFEVTVTKLEETTAGPGWFDAGE